MDFLKFLLLSLQSLQIHINMLGNGQFLSLSNKSFVCFVVKRGNY